MTAQDVQSEVLIPMRTVFIPQRPMNDAEERIALNEYADALQSFSADTLRSAWRQVRNAHKGRAWPPIGVLVDAASSTVRASAPNKPSYKSEFDANLQTWERERQTPLAKQAAREGWAWSLKLAILETGRLPSSGKIHEARVFALNRAERIAAHANDPHSSADHKRWALEGFDVIAKKEIQTRAEVLGQDRAGAA